MNKKQLVALWFGVGIEVLALSYPPWTCGGAVPWDRTWGWLWQTFRAEECLVLDTRVLTVECLIVALIFGTLIYSLRGQSKRNTTEGTRPRRFVDVEAIARQNDDRG